MLGWNWQKFLQETQAWVLFGGDKVQKSRNPPLKCVWSKSQLVWGWGRGLQRVRLYPRFNSIVLILRERVAANPAWD